MKLLVFVVAVTVAYVEAENTIRFMAVGDWGDSGSSGQARQARVAHIMDRWAEENTCDFIISTGDNFYPDGAVRDDDPRFDTQWKNMYSGDAIADLDWLICLGNHDHHNNNEVHQLAYAETEPRFVMPNYWYAETITSGPVSLLMVAIDSEAIRLNKYDPEQQKADLREFLGNSDADWKFVFDHHPPYSCGRRWGDQAIHEQIVPILDEFQVDLFISGHEHLLQHMAPIGVDYPRVDYITSGGGGRSSYDYDQGNCDTAAGLGFRPLFFDSTYGFTSFEVEENSVTVRHYTYDDSSGADEPRELYTFTRPRNTLFK